MTNLNDIVVDIVALSGGALTGRIRLQKIAYLLDQLGMDSGAEFGYHHYGPYSEPVTDAIADAKFFGNLREKIEFRQSDGGPYSIFKADKPAAEVVKLGELSSADAERYLQILGPANSTVLELAATVHWLTVVEKIADWRHEIEVRKPGKTKSGRLEKAVELLGKLDLAPN
jgi:uncharacterized protein